MRECRVFLTGEPGCGKTTVVRKVCELLGKSGRRLGGVVSGEVKVAGVRVGFSLEDLLTHERGVLAHINQSDGPRVGKYRVNLPDLQRVGVAAIERAITEADIVVVDEIGPMELHSEPFISAVHKAINAAKPLLCTIHKRASHPLVSSIRSMFTQDILEVTTGNRNSLPQTLVERLTGRE